MKKKKILIVGLAQSSHTHSWVDLIDQRKFEVRLFGVDQNRWSSMFKKLIYLIDRKYGHYLEKWWLSRMIKNWQPDIIHTLGLDPAAFFFLKTQDKFIKAKNYQWVVTIRGGSDLELERFVPAKKKIFKKIFQKCDFVFADNPITYGYAFQLGLAKNKKPPFEFVPGTGGLNIEKLSGLRKGRTSQSRIILWPKACEATYSKGLPVLEAIKIAWSKIAPCRIIMTVTDPEFMKWLDMLPPEIRQNIETHDRIPRQDLLKLMAGSRVALLPSLIDGVPNSLYEAMACKAFPIVSPLETIKTVATKKNVLFARNLYPHEIARALEKAMQDNKLVDKVVQDNLKLVRKVADRHEIGRKVNEFYGSLQNNND